jgi:hypothetical protein
VARFSLTMMPGSINGVRSAGLRKRTTERGRQDPGGMAHDDRACLHATESERARARDLIEAGNFSAGGHAA